MKKCIHLKRIIAIVLLICLTLSACAVDNGAEISALKSQIEQLQAEIERLSITEPPARPAANISLPSTSALPQGEVDIAWYEFLNSYEYWRLNLTAFRYFRAMYHGDIEDAKALAIDQNADWLSWFPTEKRSLDSVTHYFFYVTKNSEIMFYDDHTYYDPNGEPLEVVFSSIDFSSETTGSNSLIHLRTVFIDDDWKIISVANDS